MTFRDALAEQRWDDHRYYHHSRVNQSLYLVSAVGFLCAYALLVVDPMAAALVAWVFAMPARQIGHFHGLALLQSGRHALISFMVSFGASLTRSRPNQRCGGYGAPPPQGPSVRSSALSR